MGAIVHNYGTDQILSQWNAKQKMNQRKEEFSSDLDMRKKEFGMKEQEFKQRQEEFKETKTNNESTRRIQIGNNFVTLRNQADKLSQDPRTIQTSNEINEMAFDSLEKAYGFKFDKEKLKGLTGQPLNVEAQTQILQNIQDKINAGDDQSMAQASDAITTAMQNKTLDISIITALSDRIKEIKKQKDAIALKKTIPGSKPGGGGKKDYDRYRDLEGNIQSIEKGQPVPPGWMPYEKETSFTQGALPEIKPNSDALADLTEGDAAVVKKLANYELKLPTGSALKSKYWQDMMQRVAMYDPSFSQEQYAVRQGVKKDFKTGKSSLAMVSLNTSIHHLKKLSDLGKKMDNIAFTPYNTIANWISQKTGSPEVTAFNTAKEAVSGELATVFKNTSGTDQEIKAWKESIDTAQSPAQLDENIKTVIELIGGRLKSLEDKWEKGLGKTKDFNILSDSSREILGGLGVEIENIELKQKELQKEDDSVTKTDPLGIR